MSTSLRCLVTGSSGYIGGRLVPELLAAGHQVRCMARDPAKLSDRPWTDEVEIVQADVSDAGAVRRALQDVNVAYYLIHSLGTGPSFEQRDREAAGLFAEAASAAGVAAHHLSRRDPVRAARGPVPAPAFPGRGGRHPAGQRGADRRAAGRRDHRQRVGILRDAPVPHRAAAGHGHPEMGGNADPADRGQRRAPLPGRLRGAAGQREPRVRHRRPGHPYLRGDDAALHRGGRAAAAGAGPGAGADPAAVVAVGWPGHAGAVRAGHAAGGVTPQRGGVLRARHRAVRPRPAGGPGACRRGPHPGPAAYPRGRRVHPLVLRGHARRAERPAAQRPVLGGGLPVRGRPEQRGPGPAGVLVGCD